MPAGEKDEEMPDLDAQVDYLQHRRAVHSETELAGIPIH